MLSVLDIGLMYVSSPRQSSVRLRVRGRRRAGLLWVDLELPWPAGRNGEVRLQPPPLPLPPAFPSHGADGRRGAGGSIYYNLVRRIHMRKGIASRRRSWGANNVWSDPVSSTVFWLTAMRC